VHCFERNLYLSVSVSVSASVSASLSLSASLSASVYKNTAESRAKFRAGHAYAGVIRQHGVQDGFIHEWVYGCGNSGNAPGVCVHTLHRRTQHPCDFPVAVHMDDFRGLSEQDGRIAPRCGASRCRCRHGLCQQASVNRRIPQGNRTDAQYHHVGNVHLSIWEKAQSRGLQHRSTRTHDIDVTDRLLCRDGEEYFQDLQTHTPDCDDLLKCWFLK